MVPQVHLQQLQEQVVLLGLQVLQVQMVQVEHQQHPLVRQVQVKHRVQTAQMVQAVPPVLHQE
jgi:hypothetical protein